MSLVRRPALADIPCVYGEPVSITVTLTEASVAATGITACVGTITDLTGATTLATATGVEESTGVWGVNFTDTQMTNSVGHGTYAYAVTITIDGSEQTVLAGQLKVARPAIAGVVT